MCVSFSSVMAVILSESSDSGFVSTGCRVKVLGVCGGTTSKASGHWVQDLWLLVWAVGSVLKTCVLLRDV